MTEKQMEQAKASVKSFYMVRHGQTVANVQDIAAGSMDTPLTALGREQARALAAVVAGLCPAPTRIVSSPLSRALETAHLLNADIKLEILQEPLLAERSFGGWAGQPYETVIGRLRCGQTPPDGENDEAFFGRARAGIANSLTLDGLPLIVTHGGVFEALSAQCRQALDDVRNCVIYEFVSAKESGLLSWRALA